MIDLQSLQTGTENPTFIAILISVVLAVVLSALIVITYDLTTRSLERNFNFLQSLAMISLIATMVMQAVGDSLARGLGMLGALAIIRFRTNLRDPRNMTFMFASLAIGICCGAFGFTIAITGTLLFCLMAFVLRYSPFGQYQSLIGTLHVTAHDRPNIINDLADTINPFVQNYILKNYNTKDVIIPLQIDYNEYGKKIVTDSEEQRLKEIQYELKIKKGTEDGDLLDAINAKEYVKEVQLSFSNTDTVL